jgi:hypothetical protein
VRAIASLAVENHRQVVHKRTVGCIYGYQSSVDLENQRGFNKQLTPTMMDSGKRILALVKPSGGASRRVDDRMVIVTESASIGEYGSFHHYLAEQNS